ncbi:MAG: hypothetical protein QOF18_655 [Frankiaceae bacterium]|nr:hypothetical protein [Frankiaceae bacterium]
MAIRRRAPDDLEQCVALAHLVHQTDGYPARLPDDMGAFIVNRDAIGAWVATVDDRVVGHVALHRDTAPAVLAAAAEALGRSADQLAVVARLLVHPEHRRHGYGDELLQAAADEARALGKWPVLDVWLRYTQAIALYERRGWQRAGTVTVDIGAGEPLVEHVYCAPAVERAGGA